MIGKDQINPSFIGVTSRFCPSYITHVYTTFSDCEECGFQHRCLPFLLHEISWRWQHYTPLPSSHRPAQTSPPPSCQTTSAAENPSGSMGHFYGIAWGVFAFAYRLGVSCACHTLHHQSSRTHALIVMRGRAGRDVLTSHIPHCGRG